MSGRASGRRWAVAAVVGGPGLITVGLLAWALPPTVRFAPHAPVEFWTMAACSLVVDAPLFGSARRQELRVRSTLSTAFALAIFLLWGPAPAIVVQVVAAAVSAVGQRYAAPGVVLVPIRLVCALAGAEFVVRLAGGYQLSGPGQGLRPDEVMPILLFGVTWAALSVGLMVLWRVVINPGAARRHLTTAVQDLLFQVVPVLVVAPLLTVIAGPWVAAALLPLLAFSELTREQASREGRLRRDPVTGVLNRQGLRDALDELTLFDPVRGTRPQPIGFVFLNAQAAFSVAERLGRDVYEKIIHVGAVRLADARGWDLVGRLTGEAYVVLVPGLEEADAVREATALCQLMRPAAYVDGVPFDIDPTAGVALSPDHGRDLDVLVLRAQLAMTQARRSGQAAAVYVQEAQDLTHRRMAILASLHAALLDPSRHHEIAVVYQPQVAVESGRLVGAEALVRWTHPEWGPVAPDELVEAVESSEVMHLLTLHMLDRVCAQAREWNAARFRLRVAVNVSLQDLHHPDFPEQVARILHQHDLKPDQLTIEITERTIVNDAERVAAAAARICALGVGLSLDDFGTGFASMQQLRILPLTELKIDKSYVRGMTADDAQRAIVTATYQLAAALGLSVVAEGVEDGGTVAALAALPGTIGQGWRFGRPLPPDAFYQQWYQRGEQPGA